MANVLELKQQAAELNTSVKTKLKEVDAGTITVADFATFMEGAEKKDADIAAGIKAYNAAARMSGGSSEDPSGGSGEPPVHEPSLRAKQAYDNLMAYKQLRALAQANLANKGQGIGHIGFDIALKHPGDYGFDQAGHIDPELLQKALDDPSIITKAQGVANLQGDFASGTTAPQTGTLTAGQYFPGGSAGLTVEPQFLPGIVEMRFYPNVIASLFPSFPVSSPIVTYVKEATWNNAAAPTPEGATKPTSTNTVKRYTETIGKITNLVRVTDELIQDAPLFWALIQRRGVQGVQRKEEVNMLAGVGMPGINGLLNRTAVVPNSTYPTGFNAPQTVAAVTNLVIGAGVGSGTASETVASVLPGRQVELGADWKRGTERAEGILQAITDIRLTRFYEPDAAVLNPLDWQEIRLAKDANGQYLGGSFFGTNYGVAQNNGAVSNSLGVEQGLTLWNKRIVATPVEPQDLALVGAFSDAGEVLRLGGLRVDLTNTNGFDFEQNLWTMRVEERVGLRIESPELLELVQFVDAA
jgi:HK97 family phage major capsid protein